MAQKVIRSHNTIQLQRQRLRGRVSDRFLVLFVLVFLVLGFVFGGKYIGLAKYSDAVTGVFSREDSPTPVVTDEGTFVSQDSLTGGTSTASTSPGGTTTAPSNSGSGAAAQPSAPATRASACGNAVIPEGACTAILSIEQNGPKNNQHVSMDTTQIPDGSTVVINKNTWTSISDVSGSVEFVVTIYGQPYNGLLNFQLNGSLWQAVNYTTR